MDRWIYNVIELTRGPYWGNISLVPFSPQAGADPGFFLGGGAPLRNDITNGEVKKN